MSGRNRNLQIIIILILAALILLAGTAIIAGLFFAPAFQNGNISLFSLPGSSNTFASNGESIYFTGTSRTGPPISEQEPGMRMMPAGMMACVSCHGPDGKGGTLRMMMTTVQVPDIRYTTLTQSVPAYTDETIKRAITQGIDEEGKPLNWPMPRWQMSDSQLNDLIAYLKTLK